VGERSLLTGARGGDGCEGLARTFFGTILFATAERFEVADAGSVGRLGGRF
jgi:hypothetical protein